MEKFSKKYINKFVMDKIRWSEFTYGFKSYDGYEQVKDKDFKIIIAYGEYRQMIIIMNNWLLDWDIK